MVTPEQLKELGPEFAAKSDEYLQLWIDYAKALIAESAWGANYDPAVKVLSAHFATLGIRQGAGAPVKSVTVGQTSVSYGTTVSERAGLEGTEYGSMYMMLLRSNIVAPMVL